MFQTKTQNTVSSQFYQDRDQLLSLYYQLAFLLKQDKEAQARGLSQRIKDHIKEMENLEYQAFTIKLIRLQHELSWAYTGLRGKRKATLEERELRRQIDHLSLPFLNRPVTGS